MISFKCSKADSKLIDRIALRAAQEAALVPMEYTVKDAAMDLTACHCNGCPLDLKKLLAAGDADFGHDVFGIRRFLDRTTGKIDSRRFDPRCALPQAALDERTEQEKADDYDTHPDRLRDLHEDADAEDPTLDEGSEP